MGKQAKKVAKSEAKVSNQKNHNRATKFSHSKNRPCVWSRAKDKEGNIHEVLYPRNTQWDWSRTHDAVTTEDGITKLLPKKANSPLWEPYDRLKDDWSDNLQGYAELNKAKISREIVSPGLYRYTVYRYVQDPHFPSQQKKDVLLTVESGKSLNFGSTRRRRRKK